MNDIPGSSTFPDYLEQGLLQQPSRVQPLQIAIDIPQRKKLKMLKKSYARSVKKLGAARTADLQVINEKLRRSEELFQKAFNLAPAMMSISRYEDGQIIDANKTWLKVLGYAKEEVIGRNPVDIGITGAEYFSKTRLDIINAKGHYSPEINLRTKSDSIVTIITTSEKINMAGEPCLLVCGIDFTHGKKLQQEMARLERLNLIGEMAASIGHEMRNPMTAVRGFLQMFANKEEHKQEQAYFELMIEELDRANAILTEYLAMAKDKKVDLKAGHIDPVIVSLSPIIHAEANCREMNLKLNLSLPGKIMLDENEIRQLILNLAHNGLDAMQKGGTLTISNEAIDNNIVLSVKDEGSGLPHDLVDRIGTPFLTTKPNGTGLGLAVCFSIAARHNAKIEFDTGPSGTTFYVIFPMAMETN